MSKKPMKKVRCVECFHIFEVEAEATDVTCPQCGREFKVAFLGLIGGKWA